MSLNSAGKNIRFILVGWILLLLSLISCIGGTPPDVKVLYMVMYHSNGAEDGFVPSDNNDYTAGQTVTVQGNSYGLVMSSHSFAGWNTMSDGNGITYSEGDTFIMGSSDVVLYAVWTLNSVFVVSYGSNGAYTGTVPDDVSYPPGSNVTIPGNTGNLVKPGFTFTGWNTKEDGTGTSYAPGDTLAIGSSDVVLYAEWTP